VNTSRAVADLIWTINSPTLVASPEAQRQPLPRVDRAAIDKRQLQAFLDSAPSNRVGRYFERLVHFYLQFIQRYEIVANQQQIKVDGRTVGEFDFLYRDHAGLLSHLEVAVKFYLCLPDCQHNGSHFIGPSSSDTLERKTDRLFGHQLPLSRTHRPEVDRRNAMMKGRIYYPAGCTDVDVKPKHLAEGHLRGTWLRASELETFQTDPSSSYHLLRKPHWLTVDPDGPSLDRNQFRQFVHNHFEINTLPLHFAVVRNGRENARLFVVTDGWPNGPPTG
jgi:hypothetical protein